MTLMLLHIRLGNAAAGLRAAATGRGLHMQVTLPEEFALLRGDPKAEQ